MTKYKNPAPCVSVLLVDGNEILLGRRDAKAHIKPGMWSLPCGHIELRENYIQAACREFKEETNLDIEIQSIINVVSNHFEDSKHSLVVVLLARLLSERNDARAGDDLCELMWFDLRSRLPDMAFKGDIHIIDKYINRGDTFGIHIDDTEYEFFENIK